MIGGTIPRENRKWLDSLPVYNEGDGIYIYDGLIDGYFGLVVQVESGLAHILGRDSEGSDYWVFDLKTGFRTVPRTVGYQQLTLEIIAAAGLVNVTNGQARIVPSITEEDIEARIVPVN